MTQHQEIIKFLINSRLKKNISLEELSCKLNIRKKYLIALESNQLSEIPGEVYLRGYLKMYAEYLNEDIGSLSISDANIQNFDTNYNNSFNPSRSLALLSFIGLFVIINIFSNFIIKTPISSLNLRADISERKITTFNLYKNEIDKSFKTFLDNN